MEENIPKEFKQTPHEKKRLEVEEKIRKAKEDIINTPSFLKDFQKTKKLTLDFLIPHLELYLLLEKPEYKKNLEEEKERAIKDYWEFEKDFKKDISFQEAKETIEEYFKKQISQAQKEKKFLGVVIAWMLENEPLGFIEAGRHFKELAEKEKLKRGNHTRKMKKLKEKRIGEDSPIFQEEERLKEFHQVAAKKFRQLSFALDKIAAQKVTQDRPKP